MGQAVEFLGLLECAQLLKAPVYTTWHSWNKYTFTVYPAKKTTYHLLCCSECTATCVSVLAHSSITTNIQCKQWKNKLIVTATRICSIAVISSHLIWKHKAINSIKIELKAGKAYLHLIGHCRLPWPDFRDMMYKW